MSILLFSLCFLCFGLLCGGLILCRPAVVLSRVSIPFTAHWFYVLLIIDACECCHSYEKRAPSAAVQVDGLGVVGRSAPGSYGPEPGSVVEASAMAALWAKDWYAELRN